MSILSGLKSKYKSIQTFKAGVKTPKTKKHPRDSVATLIENSISYLADPTFKVKKGNKKPKAPELCYTLKDGQYEIKLRYSRENLKIIGDDTAIRCDEADLPSLLGDLHSAVKAGELDAELEEIKKKRSASQNGKTSKNAK